jgi:hypothetical protein
MNIREAARAMPKMKSKWRLAHFTNKVRTRVALSILLVSRAPETSEVEVAVLNGVLTTGGRRRLQKSFRNSLDTRRPNLSNIMLTILFIYIYIYIYIYTYNTFSAATNAPPAVEPRKVSFVAASNTCMYICIYIYIYIYICIYTPACRDCW